MVKRNRIARLCRASVVVVFVGGLVLYALGCLSTASYETYEDAERHLAAGDYLRAAVAYEKVAFSSRNATEKTKAMLAAGHARLQAGDPEGALALFRETKRENLETSLEERIDLHLGLASLALRRWNLAQRHLAPGLSAARGEEVELTLARLVLCYQQLGQPQEGAQFEVRLSFPRSPQVEEILAGRDPFFDLSPAFATDSSLFEDRPDPFIHSGTSVEGTEPGGFGAGSFHSGPSVEGTEPGGFGPGGFGAGSFGGRFGGSPLPSGTRLRVERRSSWRARPRRRNIRRMTRVTALTVHHSASEDNGSTRHGDVAQVLQAIQKYHQRDKGWADIGYHYVIDRVGRIWQGRDARFQGAHAGGANNRGNIGIAVLGNYSRRRLSRAQRQSLESLIESLSSYYRIPSSQIYTHREIYPKTECPGRELQRSVNSIRTGLATTRRRGTTLGD